VGLVGEEEILGPLVEQRGEVADLLGAIDEAGSLVRHAPYTWSTRQVVGHLIDAERVFAYRALRFARGDETPLPAFDEMAYMDQAGFDRIALARLADEFDAVRRGTIHLFENLDDAAWSRMGVASDAPVTVRALAYIIVGHVRHHAGILTRRFGLA
jgi:hypothetical protein